MSEAAKWYIIHTYSGYENKVKQDIEKVVENRKLHDLILEVQVPTETVTEITDGKTKELERKTFPGSEPTPLSESEVEKMGVDLGSSIEVNYAVGDTVTISGTAMDGFSGVVQAINLEDGTVDVMISMFGRETAATLQLNQVIRQDD